MIDKKGWSVVTLTRDFGTVEKILTEGVTEAEAQGIAAINSHKLTLYLISPEGEVRPYSQAKARNLRPLLVI